MLYEIRGPDPQRGRPGMNETVRTGALIDLEAGTWRGIGAAPGNGRSPVVFGHPLGATAAMWDAEDNV